MGTSTAILLACPSLRGSVGWWERGQEYSKTKKKGQPSVTLVFLSLPAGCWDLRVPPCPSPAAPVLRCCTLHGGRSEGYLGFFVAAGRFSKQDFDLIS